MWATILSSTPVALTVVATALAGLSSSEMTQSQYHRSLAGQHQSKASDDWNFFQAKKLRSQAMEMQAVLLRATRESGPVDERTLRAQFERMVQELAHAEQEANHLKELAGQASKSGTNGTAIQKETEQLVKTLTELHSRAEKLKAALGEWFTAHGQAETGKEAAPVAAFFALLNSKDRKSQLPQVTDRKLTQDVADPKDAELIDKVYLDIVARKSEEDTTHDIRHISTDAIKTVYNTALANARNFEIECDKFKPRFDELDRLLDQQLELAADLDRACRDFLAAVPEPADKESNELKEMRSATFVLGRYQRGVGDSARQLYRDYKVATDLYTSRRYDKEANYNRTTATVSEIQVRKSSFESERHRGRSKLFFYAMLMAQAGVTIATLSLAIKRGSLLWGLATIAGSLALCFTAYVYLSF
jgi:hypothetical protein